MHYAQFLHERKISIKGLAFEIGQHSASPLNCLDQDLLCVEIMSVGLEMLRQLDGFVCHYSN